MQGQNLSFLKPFYSKKGQMDNQDKVVVFFHNGSNFDYHFLFPGLVFNEELEKKYCLTENLKVLNVGNKYYRLNFWNIYFHDSFLLTRRSLNTLSQTLLNESKDSFNVSNLNFNSTKKIFKDQEQYDKFCQYNLNDSVLLHKCMTKLQTVFMDAQQLDISNYMSAPGLGIDYFFKKYYKLPKQPFILKLDSQINEGSYYVDYSTKHVNLKTASNAIFVTPAYLENRLRQSFFGGRTELYKPSIKDGMYIDINSLYPFAATAPLPFGPPDLKIDLINAKFSESDFMNFYGFFKIEFLTPPNLKLLPVLPRKHPDGHNVYALGHGEGWYFSKEVQLAYRMGYKIRILESIELKPGLSMRYFVKELFNLRQKYEKTHPLNMLYKDILNSTSYGKFATKIESTLLDFRVFDESPYLAFKKSQESSKSIWRNYFKNNRLHQVDCSKKDAFFNQSEYKKLNHALHISAAVTAQARLCMYPFMAKLYKDGGLFYSDTDSIFCDQKMEAFLKPRMNNKKIGFFKLEKMIDEGLYLGPKMYVLQSHSSEEVFQEIKFKGVNKDQLKKAIQDEDLLVFFKEKMEKDEGVITIAVKDVHRLQSCLSKLNVYATYTNSITFSNFYFEQYRKKIIENKRWVNTQSLILNLDFEEIELKQLESLYRTYYSNVEIKNLFNKFF
jgi:hypothetical protein